MADYSYEELKQKVKEMEYQPLTAEDLGVLSPLYRLRPNKSCDSAPLCHYLYNYYYRVRFCRFEDALLVMFCSDEGEIYGFLPYCQEDRIDYYFRLQQVYFNDILGIPLMISSADEEGVALLQASGALENYKVVEQEDAKDYLYDGEALRTLAGRKYSKKRNHIHKFNQAYEGRWEYRTLRYEDRDEILAFLRVWMDRKEAVGDIEGVNERNESFNSIEELEAEFRGIQDIISNEELFRYFRIGGVNVDGKLEAFSLGDYNPLRKVAIIDVEKANEDIPGLYQIINQQFLIHEYPDAEIINREDDVGIEGLRQSKLSYYPAGYERKFWLEQTDAQEK